MSDSRVAVVVLAAGASTRLGRPKQLVDWQGTTLIARAARTALAAGIGPVFVVLGAEAEPCRKALSGLDVAVVTNPDWPLGISTSIRAGVDAAAARDDCGAVMLMTCDQPGVDAGHLRSLEAAWRAGSAMAASAYGGTLGVPACFDRGRYADLRKLTGDQGARGLLASAAPGEVAAIGSPRCEQDIDSASDIRRWNRSPR